MVRLVACASYSAIESLLKLALDSHDGLLLSVNAAAVLVCQHSIFSSVLKELCLGVGVAVCVERSSRTRPVTNVAVREVLL